ncbi:MAG: PEP-CTERM sorting domain-containing protein [Phycisphaerae bacterium]|nr:PEP-CTERM sorting domain-containing protein [Phycisphaerae bacterium]
MRNIALVSFIVVGLATAAGAQTFSNPTTIDWGTGTSGSALLYPSQIDVSGLAYPIESVTVTLFGIEHSWPCDLDILLVGPTGANVLLMSDAGYFHDIYAVDLTFADGFPAVPTPIVSGTYCPSNEGTSADEFPAPAPAGPWGSEMAVFSGLDGNGIWDLYVVDDASLDTGEIAGGWSITITQVPEPSALALLVLGGVTLVRRRR